VFEDDVADLEIEGVEVGTYDDFHVFREAVSKLESGGWGSQFPVLMLHSDCDGEWPIEDLTGLSQELTEIRTAFAGQPPPDYEEGWQRDIATQTGHRPTSMANFFIDVDGEALVDRLVSLVEVALRRGRPVTFA
jgi:hypothetical protein